MSDGFENVPMDSGSRSAHPGDDLLQSKKNLIARLRLRYGKKSNESINQSIKRSKKRRKCPLCTNKLLASKPSSPSTYLGALQRLEQLINGLLIRTTIRQAFLIHLGSTSSSHLQQTEMTKGSKERRRKEKTTMFKRTPNRRRRANFLCVEKRGGQ